MKSWSVPAEISALAQRVTRHPDPPAARDQDACDALYRLVRAAADALAELHPSLVVVASAPSRFNDVAWYDWLLVRVGDVAVEHDEYMGPRAEYQRLIEAASDSVRKAATVLERLEADDWRQLFVRAFDLPLDDEFVAVVIQHGLPWFVYASSNLSGREHVFALWGEELSYFGECVERSDDELIDERGLVFVEQNPE